MSNTVKVQIGRDYETGEYEYARVIDDSQCRAEWVFEIPEETFAEWEHARREWTSITDTLGEMHRARSRENDINRERARLLTQLQAAQAAYDAHLAETGQ